MLKAIMILSLIVAGLSVLFIIQLKRIKKIKRKLEISELQFESAKQNGINYKKIIVKLNEKNKVSNEVKKNIDNATGDALSKLANSL